MILVKIWQNWETLLKRIYLCSWNVAVLMFIINADCILCEARDENEGNVEDPNSIIEQYQYFTISEASISNLLVRVRYRENS